MNSVRIKICGITRPQDGVAAAEAGADAIGLVFHRPSKRAVSIEQANSVVESLAPFVSVVALFVDAGEDDIRNVLDNVPVDVLQFHGAEPAAFCEQFGRPWIKALHVRSSQELAAQALQYPGSRGLLLDTFKEGVAGGTGETFDWDLARQPLPKPMILAGGLTPDNVGGAIQALCPAAVDVSGGVEAAPGVKDAQKIARFVAAVRAAQP
jgi:phosphoribosylanthranilate isomerase